MGKESVNVARAIAFQVGLVRLAIARKLIVRVCQRMVRARFAVVMVIAFAENVIVNRMEINVIRDNFAKNARFVF